MNTRREQLMKWLASHGAVCLWSQDVSKDEDRALKVECWQVGGGLVLVTLYGAGGFDVYTPAPNTIKVDESLQDAERRLGLRPRNPLKRLRKPAKETNV